MDAHGGGEREKDLGRDEPAQGIHPDAVELLKDKPIGTHTLHLLRKPNPVRQIDMAHLMVSGNNFTRHYAEALIIERYRTNW